MTRSAHAGVVYFALVFAAGFVLGTLRVLIAVPRLGELAGTLIELPIILTAAWIICAQVFTRFDVPRRWQARVVMGGVAFGLLMLAEFTLSITLFGNSVAEHLGAYRSLHGALGLAAQGAFAAFPLLQIRTSRGWPVVGHRGSSR